MRNSPRVAAAMAIVAIVGVGACNSRAPGASGGAEAPTSSPTASSSPAPTVGPSPSGAPNSFTSPLYRYTVTVPAGWVAPSRPATDQWPDGGIADDTPDGNWYDVFIGGGAGTVGFVAVAAQPIPGGITADGWMRAYAKRQAASDFACKGPADAWVDEVVGTLATRRLAIICNGRMGGDTVTSLHADAVVFVVKGTGYQMTGNPEGIGSLLSSFQPA